MRSGVHSALGQTPRQEPPEAPRRLDAAERRFRPRLMPVLHLFDRIARKL